MGTDVCKATATEVYFNQERLWLDYRQVLNAIIYEKHRVVIGWLIVNQANLVGIWTRLQPVIFKPCLRKCTSIIIFLWSDQVFLRRLITYVLSVHFQRRFLKIPRRWENHTLVLRRNNIVDLACHHSICLLIWPRCYMLMLVSKGAIPTIVENDLRV